EERERTGEVHYYQARFAFLLSARFQIELDTRHRKDKEAYPRESLRSDLDVYHADIARSAQKARELLPKESPLRPAALQLEGQGWYEARNYAAAEKAYSIFLETYPEHELSANVLAALGRALISLERYDDGIKRLKDGLRLAAIDKSSSYPYVIESLWRLHEAKGDPTGMIDVCESVAKLFPYRMSDTSRTEREREVYGQFLVFNGFRLGYGLCAQGRFDDARSAWERFASELGNQKQTVGKLPPYAEIYLKRTRDSLSFLDTKARRAAPTELDLVWATSKQVELSKAHGKVVGIVFRFVGDQRSAPFLQGLDEIYAGADDVALVATHFLKGANNLDAQLEELLIELAQLEYRSAAGFDPDADGKRIFRTFGANVGSATFFVVDTEGKLVWFQQDPRAVDVNLAKSIIERNRKRETTKKDGD
ncbi:MAG TPA: hypothetical protein VK116_18725, partial [Planctomycetota bacterium]|nr:hypothetical protein [Planctomycetota bacterium]